MHLPLPPPKNKSQELVLRTLSQKGIKNLSLYRLTKEGGALQVRSNTVYSVQSLWKENISTVSKLRHSHLQWVPEVLNPLHFLSQCWSRNMMVHPTALKYILQTPRVYSYYPTNSSFAETPKCLKWVNYDSQHDISCCIFSLLNNDCVVETYMEQRRKKIYWQKTQYLSGPH